MSDVTALEKGELKPAAFILKVGGELASSPWAKMFAPVALYLLQTELTKFTGATLASLIVADIQTVMNGGTPDWTDQAEQEAAALFAKAA